MPNKKLSELEQIVSLATGDQMLISDISAAVNEKSKYVTIQQLDARYAIFQPSVVPIGEMYQIANAIATDIVTQGVSVKVVNFTQGIVQGITFASSALTMTLVGKYLLNVSLSGFKTTGTNTRQYEFAIFVNGIESTKIKTTRDFTNQIVGAINLTGILNLAVDDVLDLRIACLDDTLDFTVADCNLNLTGQ